MGLYPIHLFMSGDYLTLKANLRFIVITLSLRYRRSCQTNLPEIVLGVGHFSVIICPLGGSVLGYHNQQALPPDQNPNLYVQP